MGKRGGVAIGLPREECPRGVDPLSPDNPIVFAVGLLTGLFPSTKLSRAASSMPPPCMGARASRLAFGGNEMPGYHTGPGAYLGFLVGARHSHLDSADHSVDQKALVKKQIGSDGLAREILKEELRRQVPSSLVVCFFACGIHSPGTIVAVLRVAGFDRGHEDLRRIGADIHRRKYAFKPRGGFSLDALRVPGRIFETVSPVGMQDERHLRAAADSVREQTGVGDQARGRWKWYLVQGQGMPGECLGTHPQQSLGFLVRHQRLVIGDHGAVAVVAANGEL